MGRSSAVIQSNLHLFSFSMSRFRSGFERISLHDIPSTYERPFFLNEQPLYITLPRESNLLGAQHSLEENILFDVVQSIDYIRFSTGLGTILKSFEIFIQSNCQSNTLYFMPSTAVFSSSRFHKLIDSRSAPEAFENQRKMCI